MADRTLAGGLALKGAWGLGEDGWKVDMDLNLLKLSVIAGRKVKDRVSATPGAPTEGDVYLFKADHPTQPNKIAAYDGGAWTYLDPVDGYKLFNFADGIEYLYTTASGWAAVVAGMTTEQIQDMIASFLAAGTNVTLTYNDAGNVLTVAASGGGGGGSKTTVGSTEGLIVSSFSPAVNNYLMRFLVVDADITVDRVAFTCPIAVATTKYQPFIYSVNATVTTLLALLGSGPQITGHAAGYNEAPLTTPVALTKGMFIMVGCNVITTAMNIHALGSGVVAFAANGSSSVPASSPPAITTAAPANGIYAFYAR